MRYISERALGPATALLIAVAAAGCNQIFGITETTLSERHAYGCECQCSGGGQAFSVNDEVCLPPDLNPALNPDLPDDFQPPVTALQNDCHVRVERNLEQMARQCVANRIRCTCNAVADLVDSFGRCDTPCAAQDLAADCGNFDPQAGTVTATNVPGQPPVCVADASASTGPPPAPFAAAILGRTTQCQVNGSVTVSRDGDTQSRPAAGVSEFSGTPCPGGTCAVGVSYRLDHVDPFSFDGFAGFASVEFKDIGAAGTSDPAAAVVGADGLGVLAAGTTRNAGRGKRSNQILGGETSSDTAAYTGSNGAPIGVLVDWDAHSCGLAGAVLGSVEDADTAVSMDLAGTILNEPPTADVGATPAIVECTSPAGATVTLDGRASSDPEDNIALFAWRRGSRTGDDVGGDPLVQVTQGLGVQETYVLTVVDALGQTSRAETSVAVVDSTPPTITGVAAAPSRLWPPNHKLVPVTVTATADDVCGTASCRIVGVRSNEPVDGPGDGHTAPDWEITGPATVSLRAERAGGGTGRIYTIDVACADPSGNASTASTTVTVAH